MRLRDLVVLVTEDDPVLGVDLAFALEDEGAQPRGPFRKLADAQAALDAALPDAAILDVELLDGEVFPVAERLKSAGIPYLFYTSQASTGQAAARRDGAPVLSKAKSSHEAVLRLARLVEDDTGRGPHGDPSA